MYHVYSGFSYGTGGLGRTKRKKSTKQSRAQGPALLAFHFFGNAFSFLRSRRYTGKKIRYAPKDTAAR